MQYMAIFIRKNFFHQGLLSETLYFELVICFKGTLASLLLQSVS